ncbi:MAG: uracil-DNA glycosylase family protein [Rhizobiaceae bacterium]|nr:uracil-DNA glycosylase family protein [Rhizobiaceae bacterium]
MSSARAKKLADKVAEIRACRICLDHPEGKPLPHEPRPVVVPSASARIMIAGQAPGTRVHESGRPFTDRSGDRLREWLGVSDAEFYDTDNFAIVPMGFCFPGLDAKGGDLPPRRECAPAWRADLMAAMPQIDLLLVIGQYAQGWHLGLKGKRSVTETVRGWRDFAARNTAPLIIPLPHPSWRNTGWLKANPWFGEELLPVLRRAVDERITRH